MKPELFVVVGPNGSGKSSAIYETHVDDSILFVNPDDIAKEDFSNIEDIDERNKLAWVACNAQRDLLLSRKVTFGFETVGSHPSKVDLINRAKELGYKVTLLFVATEDPEINIERIKGRQLKGGHGVPDDKVRSRYTRTLNLLKEYFDAADEAYVWDNSHTAQDENECSIKELVRKTSSGIEILPDAECVKWVQEHLISKL